MLKLLPKYQMKIIFILVAVLFSVSLLSAQTPTKVDTQALQKQILIFYQQGNFDKAIPLAEKVLKLEKKKSTKSPQSLATANYNIALLRKKRLIINKDKVTNWQNVGKKELRNAYKTNDEDALKADKHFREVIKIHKMEIARPTLNESLQLASTQSELAWILYNHNFPAKKIGFKERLITAEEFYKSAFSLYKTLLGDDANETISVTFNFAEFYTKQANFEKALPLYQRFISTATKKYGDDKKIILPALTSIAKIFVTIDKMKEAVNTINLISRITKNRELLPPANHTLNSRITENKNAKDPGFRRDSFNSWQVSDTSSYANRYPSVTSYVTKRVRVKILVDEKGEVIDATSNYENRVLRNEAVANVKRWKFRPFELDGKKSKMNGYAIYVKTILR